MTKSIEVVIPVLNEEAILCPNIERLADFLSRNFTSHDWRIIIADNGSTDSTPLLARQLSDDHERVVYFRLEEKGRGRALRCVWLASDADILAYMDVDLSAELSAFPLLVNAIGSQGYDLAIGSRIKVGAQVIGRPFRREVISRVYSLIFRNMFSTGLFDFQCGFKAISRQAASDLLELVKDNGWFFDSELLVLASSNGYRIKEVPIRWTDNLDSRVRIIPTAYSDVKGLLKLRFGGLRKASQQLSDRCG